MLGLKGGQLVKVNGGLPGLVFLVDNAQAGIFLDLPGIAEDITDGQDQEEGKGHNPKAHPRIEGQFGNALGYTDGEGVHEGGGEAGPGTGQDHGHPGDGVKSQSQGQGHHDGDEGEGLFGHAEDAAPNGKDGHDHGDDEPLPSLQGPGDSTDGSFDGPRSLNHGEGGPDDKDEEDDVSSLHHPLVEGLEELPEADGCRIYCVVGIGVDDHPPAGTLYPIVLARSEDIGAEGGN